jgi:hypothetical protein
MLSKRSDSKPALGSKDKPEEKKVLAGVIAGPVAGAGAGSADESPHPEKLDIEEGKRIAKERLKKARSGPTVYVLGHYGEVTGVKPPKQKELKLNATTLPILIKLLETSNNSVFSKHRYDLTKSRSESEHKDFLDNAFEYFKLRIKELMK